MGCDIHLFVEAKKNGAWESMDRWVVDEDYDAPRETVPYEARFYKGRNYNLFAILADVRNGRGFAGIKTGEGFNPISQPKGLPDDVSQKVKAESAAWDGDGHSHSWHTLADLLAFDWTQTTGLSGYVNAEQYWAWSRYRKGQGLGPEEYCGDVSGGAVRKVSNKEMDDLLKPIIGQHQQYQAIKKEIEKKLPSAYTLAEWETPYARCAENFWSELIPRLLAIGKPEDVRIVFWFDN